MGNLSEMDDLVLIRQIQHGDEAAMEEFYRRFASGVIAFLRCRAKDPRDVEDILAETMAAAVSAIMRFRGESRVFTWLCRIAEYKLADYYRRQYRRETVPLEETQIAHRENADLESNLLITQALLGLNREYRAVLEDKYFSGYSTREIASRVGKTEKAVESILVRARRAFAQEFRRLAPDLEV